jgi:hypothetical protein
MIPASMGGRERETSSYITCHLPCKIRRDRLRSAYGQECETQRLEVDLHVRAGRCTLLVIAVVATCVHSGVSRASAPDDWSQVDMLA